MQYFASHYWHAEESDSMAVALHQAYHRGRKLPILLACVEHINSKGQCFSGRLTNWFYGEGLSLCGTYGERKTEVIEERLQHLLDKESPEGQASGYSKEEWGTFAGILCVGATFFIFRKNDRKIRLLNTRNGRPHCREVSGLREDGGSDIRAGSMQRGVGILLTTEGFDRAVSQKMVEECLDVQKLHSQHRVDSRLRELGDYARQCCSSEVGAVLLVVR